MSERSQRCKFSAHDACAGGSCTCTCHDPNHLASIAESLEKLANPLITLNAPLSESEKFFAHLNNGEVELKQHFEYLPGKTLISFRIVISPKEESK